MNISKPTSQVCQLSNDTSLVYFFFADYYLYKQKTYTIPCLMKKKYQLLPISIFNSIVLFSRNPKKYCIINKTLIHQLDQACPTYYSKGGTLFPSQTLSFCYVDFRRFNTRRRKRTTTKSRVLQTIVRLPLLLVPLLWILPIMRLVQKDGGGWRPRTPDFSNLADRGR